MKKMKNIKTISFLLFLIALAIGCKKDEATFGSLTAPAKPVLNIDVVGKTDAMPYGDGSGKIIITATSDNAINYRFDFGDGLPDSTKSYNTTNYGYKHTGLKDLIVTVTAFGRGGVSSSTSQKITVQRDFVPNAELVAQLTGGSSKTWVIDSTAAGHLGVGPSDGMEPTWWAAPPLDKSNLGIYDDEYTFNSSGNMFTHTTHNSLYGKKFYLLDFNPALTGDVTKDFDYTLEGPTAATYSETFSYDGDGADEEFIVFSQKGHMGNYVGEHKFQVLSRSDSNMHLRTVDDLGRAWYVKIKAK